MPLGKNKPALHFQQTLKFISMAKRGLKTRNGGTMTEAQYLAKLRSSLRRSFRWWIPLQQALNAARRPSQNKDNKRLKFEYQCAHCKKWFPRSGVEVDHVNPCGSLLSLTDLVEFVRKLTPENLDAYQVLCKEHHREKTNKEAVILKSSKSLQ